MRLSIWYSVEIFGSLLCCSLFISFTFSYLAVLLLCLSVAWKYRIGSFGDSEVTRAQCLGQWWIHALRQSRLLLEDSPLVTQFSVTGREQSLPPVLRELSSLGKRSPARASCPCLMKHNSLIHLSGRRFLPSVATCSVSTFPFVAIVRGAISTPSLQGAVITRETVSRSGTTTTSSTGATVICVPRRPDRWVSELTVYMAGGPVVID